MVRGKIRVLSHARPDSSKPFPPARGFDVFCLPIIDWGFRVQRPQQLLKQFAADGHRVFYAKTGFLGLDREPEVSELAERTWEVSLPGEHDFDFYSRTLAEETLEQSYSAILELAVSYRIRDAVLLVHYPSWEPLARAVADALRWRLVYDCMDEHTGFGTHGHETAADEERLIQEADLVLVTSRKLEERASRLRADVLRLPNAGEEQHFARLPPRHASPIASLPRPVIGYYGAISSWFDTDAVQEAASRHPDWSFALVGTRADPSSRRCRRCRTSSFPAKFRTPSFPRGSRPSTSARSRSGALRSRRRPTPSRSSSTSRPASPSSPEGFRSSNRTPMSSRCTRRRKISLRLSSRPSGKASRRVRPRTGGGASPARTPGRRATRSCASGSVRSPIASVAAFRRRSPCRERERPPWPAGRRRSAGSPG